jgi:hypothetical protein
MKRWVWTMVALFVSAALAHGCPSCSGDTPPDEDGAQMGGEAVAYGLSIAMLIGAPAFMTCALGYAATRTGIDHPPGDAR